VILSDRHRAFVAPALGVALLALGAAWTLDPRSRAPADRCWAEPAACAGERHRLPLVRVVDVDPGGSYLLRSGPTTLRAIGAGPLVVGDIVSVDGFFQPDGTLRIDAAASHPWRVHKGALGVIGVLGLAAILAVVFRVRRTGAGWRVVPSGVGDA
jgi:hypothetical protein